MAFSDSRQITFVQLVTESYLDIFAMPKNPKTARNSYAVRALQNTNVIFFSNNISSFLSHLQSRFFSINSKYLNSTVCFAD